jgi:hypothetical protein
MESVYKFVLRRGIGIQKGTLTFRQNFYYESGYLKTQGIKNVYVNFIYCVILGHIMIDF